MYKNIFPKVLSHSKLKLENKKAQDDERYCNGLCQKFIKTTLFSPSKSLCRECRNFTNLAIAGIKAGRYSELDIQQNPQIVYPEQHISTLTKTCNVCKTKKSLSLFPVNKTICKSCKWKQTKKRDNDVETEVNEIIALRDNNVELQRFVQCISKGKIINIIKHFKVGRKSTDNVETMRRNLTNHFKNNDDTTTTTRKEQTLQEFVDNEIPLYIKSPSLNQLQGLNKDQVYKLGKIGYKLKVTKIMSKEDIMKIVSTHIEKITKDTEVSGKVSGEVEEVCGEVEEVCGEICGKDELEVSGEDDDDVVLFEWEKFKIQARKRDGFINATHLCSVKGKKFAYWYKTKDAKEHIEALIRFLSREKEKNSELGIFTSYKNENDREMNIRRTHKNENDDLPKVMEIRKGNTSRYKQGTWVHPDLAIIVAMWVDKDFGCQVTRWVRQILLTGKVELGNEKSNEELIRIQKEQMEKLKLENEEQEEQVEKLKLENEEQEKKMKKLKLENEEKNKDYKLLSNKHNQMLKKRQYHKLKKGDCVYIVRDPDCRVLRYKVGKAGDINTRLQQYRTSIPCVKLEFLVYLEKDNTKLLESIILTFYKQKLMPHSNHEWIHNVSLGEIIIQIFETINRALNVEYTVSDEIGLYNDE